MDILENCTRKLNLIICKYLLFKMNAFSFYQRDGIECAGEMQRARV